MILALSGKSKSGKTTAALYLANDCGFAHRSFAQVLRGYVAAIFGTTEKNLMDVNIKEGPSTVAGYSWRDLLKKTGAFLRSLDPNFMVDRMDFSGKLVAIDDARFKNEARKVKEMGGVIVRIHRPVGKDDPDISEVDLDDWPWDYEIDNFGDYQQLYNQLDAMLAKLGLKGGTVGN
jgi:hypothetical protein